MIAWAFLLADGGGRKLDKLSRLNAMRQGFTDENVADYSTLIAWLFVIVAAAGLIAMSVQVVSRLRRNGIPQSKYLGEAMRVLALTKPEADDVRTVVRRARIEHSVSVLLSPANLARAVVLARKRKPDPELERRMDRLCRRLFGVDLPPKHS
jgi:hypothetical protein